MKTIRLMDMDFDNCIDMRGVDDAIKSWHSLRWNACTAVTKTYYDFWALRLPSVMNYDCWKDKDVIAKHGNCWKYAGWQPKEITWVKSAFNGLVIHRMSAISSSGCEYDGRHSSGEETCEHVSFYQCLGRVVTTTTTDDTWTVVDHDRCITSETTGDTSRNETEL